MRPELSELDLPLQKILDPSKAKVLMMVAKGAAPVPPPLLVASWCYLSDDSTVEIAEAAQKSLLEYPEKMLIPVVKGELPSWALHHLGQKFSGKDQILEAVLLNEATPNAFFVEIAKSCTEKFTTLISNNQERIIDCPEIVKSLEENPRNLKSATDRLRHFLNLAGISIPGEPPLPDDPAGDEKIEDVIPKEGVDAEEEGENVDEAGLTEEEVEKKKKRVSLNQYIMTLSVGARVKLGFKGNREARSILVRDTNKIVAMAVLKSPRLTDNEIARFATMRNVADDVIRGIGANVTWTKAYAVKMALCLNPKTPFNQSLGFLKFLNFRDLQRLTREKNIPGSLRKSSKELLNSKRK